MRYRPPERKIKDPALKNAFIKRWFFRLFLIIILFTGVVFGLRALSYAKSLSIEEIYIEGVVYADSSEIEKTVERYLNIPVLGVFSRRNFFLVSSYKLEKFIKEEIKGLKGVNVDIKDKKVTLNIIEYKPDFLWCGDTPPLVWDEVVSCFYVSEDGFVFSKAPFFSGDVFFKFYGPLGEGFSVIPVGSRISDLTEFLALVDFKNELKNMGLQPESIALSGLETITIGLWRGDGRDETQISPKIIFNKNQNFRTLARHLKAAISQGELSVLLETNYDNLIHIELRTDNKVYYSFLKSK